MGYGQKCRKDLISGLRLIRSEHGYLPERELKALADRLGMPLKDIIYAANLSSELSPKQAPAGKTRILSDAANK
jgi:NADH:ubiquinone oxidoreductase subunit E